MERFILAMLGFVLFSLQALAREPLDPADAAEIIKNFQYEGVYKELSNYKSGSIFDRCWSYDIRFETDYPGANEPLVVDMRIYRPNPRTVKGEMLPSVILLPPIGGINLLDKNTAKTLCDSKMVGIIVANDFANIESQASGKLNPPEDHQETFFRISGAIKGIMKMIERDEQLNSSKIGMFGVSLGGILGSFVMASQPDISAGYFIVAGGDIPNILAYSEQEKISDIRRKRMREENFSDKAEYEAYLRNYVLFDPIDLAITMIPETLNMVISKDDNVVPSLNQEALYQAFGEPDVTYSYEGHVATIIGFLFPGSGRSKVARFFKQRFALDNPRPEHFNFVETELFLASY